MSGHWTSCSSGPDEETLPAPGVDEIEQQAAESEAEIQRIKTEADIQAVQSREQSAQAYSQHPALLRLMELETLRELAKTANARIYVNFNEPKTSLDDKE